MAFATYLLDEALTRRATQFESDRQATLAKVATMLQELGTRYRIERAWIFGSVIRPHRFTEDSDIDLAVEQIEPTDFFNTISAFSRYWGREVDLVELKKCHFAHRIREHGILWTRTR